MIFHDIRGKIVKIINGNQFPHYFSFENIKPGNGHIIRPEKGVPTSKRESLEVNTNQYFFKSSKKKAPLGAWISTYSNNLNGFSS
jgi:hypothetical protein